MTDAAVIGAAPEASTSCELADVLRRYGPAYTATRRLRGVQSKAFAAILRCRTSAMGGHRHWCAACGFERYAYHSCRNRHCPKCQSATTAAWAAARRADLLPTPGVIHCFTSGAALAESCLKQGFAISFSGIVTYPSAKELQDVAKSLPLDRLMVETDCPYLAPVPRRRHWPNEPAFVRHTAEFLAELRGESLEELAGATTANFERLFLSGRAPGRPA